MQKDVLYIIDLDRTLIDIGKVMDVTRQVCKEMGIDFKKIYKEQQDLSKRGTAYSPFSHIASHSSVDIEEFKTRFIKASAEDRLLFSDSWQLIDGLRELGADCLILTHGVDDEWQILKLRAARLEKTPYLIVKDRYKARFINSWVKDDGLFAPDIKTLKSYKKCVFVDDRQEAFVDLPGNCQGYLLNRTGNNEVEMKLPGNVKIIKSLSEIPL